MPLILISEDFLLSVGRRRPFLQNLCADTARLIFPQSPDLGSSDLLLGSGIRIVGINQNVRINEDLGGHVVSLGLASF